MIEYTVKVYSNGTREWHLNGKCHREDRSETGVSLPAVEFADGSKCWYLNGKRHREDGPAVECADGTKSWYLNDKYYSEANWKLEVAKLNKQPVSCNSKEIEIDGKKYKLVAV